MANTAPAEANCLIKLAPSQTQDDCFARPPMLITHGRLREMCRCLLSASEAHIERPLVASERRGAHKTLIGFVCCVRRRLAGNLCTKAVAPDLGRSSVRRCTRLSCRCLRGTTKDRPGTKWLWNGECCVILINMLLLLVVVLLSSFARRLDHEFQ